MMIKREKAVEYINRNGKFWYQQIQTKKLIRTVAWLMLGSKIPKWWR